MTLKEFIDLEQRVGSAEAMQLLGCSYQHLQDLMREDADFPEPAKISARLSWSLRELKEYIEVRKRKTRVEREAFRAKRRKEAKRRWATQRRMATGAAD